MGTQTFMCIVRETSKRFNSPVRSFFLLDVVYSAQNELIFENDTQLSAQAVTFSNFIGT
jgi:hypothetical protein